MPAIGSGAAYNSQLWNVFVQAQNKYVYFTDLASAQADIKRYNYGQLMGPNAAPPQQPAALAGKLGEGAGYNPAYFNVHVAALKKFLYFGDQASAQADIQAHSYGQLIPPNSQFTPPAAPAPQMNSTPQQSPGGAPPSSTGWWQVHAGAKSWKFTDPALAMRCMQAVGGRISGNVAASSMPQVANPQGPTYN